LGGRAHYSAAALSDAAGGRRLPSLAVTLAYVAACDGDTATWEERWHAIAAELAGSAMDEPADDNGGPAPYVGLAAFQITDARRFFGRERLVAELADQVARQRFVMVVGPSGSGKSSLLRAGLVNRVHTRGLNGFPDSPILMLTPGPHPLEECAVQLAALVPSDPSSLHTVLRTDPRGLHLTALQALINHPAHAELVVVVDQFEEVFTLCRSPQERARFLEVLQIAAHAPNSRVRVVLAVRADFYAHCAHYPVLIEALRDAQILVGPMNTEELRSVITQPALAAGFRVETALVSQVIADAAGQAGVLPLMSHALLETWRRRRGTTLTLTGYQAIGGITQSIAHTAEAIYTSFSAEQQRWARQLFIRLVALGEGTEDTKRRVPRTELDLDNSESAAVLEQLARARLLALDRDSVEIAHEALVRCWPRLQGWLTDNREVLRLQRQLTDAANTWEELQRDPGSLYRGSRLSQTGHWATTGGNDMVTPRERAFLQTSLAAQAHEQTVSRRRTRRLRQLLVLLTVLLATTTATTIYALQAQRITVEQRNLAIAEKVLGQATALSASNPPLALQLSLAAYRLAPNPESRGDVLNLVAAPYATLLTGHAVHGQSLAFSPTAHLLADTTASVDPSTPGYQVEIWNITDPSRPRMLPPLPRPSGGSITAVAFSPDGHLLAAADSNRSVVELWDLTDPTHPQPWESLSGASGETTNVVFSPDGKTLATAGGTDTHKANYDNVVRLWDVTYRGESRELDSLHGSATASAALAFSPDGHTLATAGVAAADSQGTANEIWLWDASNLQQLRQLTSLGEIGSGPVHIVFSPDGHTLATAGINADHATGSDFGVGAWLWDMGNRDHPRPLFFFPIFTAPFAPMAFSPDGFTLAVVNSDKTVGLWDVTDPGQPLYVTNILGPTAAVTAVLFSPDGRDLANVTADGAMRLDNVSNNVFPGHAHGLVHSVDFSPDGHTMAMGYVYGVVRLWDVTDPYHLRLLAGFLANTNQQPVTQVKYSPTGHTLAVVNSEGAGSVELWNATDPRNPREQALLTGFTSPVRSLAFSPDSRLLVVGGDNASTELWDVTDPGHLHELAPLAVSSGVVAEAFATDHSTLATAGGGTIQLWNTSDAGHPIRLTTLTQSTNPVLAVAFSPDGHTLATAAGAVTLWDTTPIGHPQVAATLPESAGKPYSVGFSPDGHTLATGGSDGTVELWDTADTHHPRPTATLTGLTSTVSAVAFSPNNHTLAIISADVSPRLWETSIDLAAAHICDVAWPTITNSEWERYFPGLTYNPPCT
jgi:WD40 repeat protein/energy-coupling factor transporter ATP-binding protein EcfA2